MTSVSGPWGTSSNMSADSIRTPVPYQATVTVTVTPDEAEVEFRLANSSNEDADTIPYGSEKEVYQINTHDPLICMVPRININPKHPVALACYNGQDISEYMTSEDMQADQRYVGSAMEDKSFKTYEEGNKDYEKKLGSVKGGDIPIKHRGNKTISACDRVVLKVPYFDKFLGLFPDENWAKNNQHNFYQGSRKITPQLDTFDPTHTKGLKQRMFYRAFVNMESYTPFSEVLDSKTATGKKPSIIDMAALSDVYSVVSHGMALIHILQMRQVIVVNTPEKMKEHNILQRMKDTVLREDLNDDEKLGLWEEYNRELNGLKNQKTDASTGTNTVFTEKISNDIGMEFDIENDDFYVLQEFLSEKQKQEFRNNELWLSLKLGMTKNFNMFNSDKSKGPNNKWLRDMYAQYNAKFLEGLAIDPSLKSVYNWSPAAGSTLRYPTQSSNSVAAQFERMARDAPEMDHKFHLLMLDQLYSSIIGTASCGGEPGDNMHITV